MTRFNARPPRRPGFTLVELLVVITIIAVLATLAVLIAPRFSERQRTSLGASQLQGWLFIAKNRAYRDKLNRGLRLFAGSPNANYVTTMQYIEQPDDFSAGQATSSTGPNAVNFTFPPGSNIDFNQVPILQGDYLSLNSGTEVHRITGIDPNGHTLNIQTALVSGAITTPESYAIIRQPRPMDGEPTLQLPQGVAVDFSQLNGTTLSMPGSGMPQQGYLDVLFTPSGSVQMFGTSTAKYIFWVRDTTLDSAFGGEPALIAVYARTGNIAAHPVDADSQGNNSDGKGYYSFVKDGYGSGM